MFDFLKKKITSWIKPTEEKKKKSSKSKKKTEKVSKNKKEKVVKEKITKELKSKKIVKPLKSLAIEENISQSEKEINKIEIPSQEDAKPSQEREEEIEEEVNEKSSIEEEKEEEKVKEEKKGFFGKLFSKITTQKLTQEDFNDAFEELEITLLENNVALEAVDSIRNNLSKELVGQQLKKENAKDKIISSLKDSILALLIEPPNLIEEIKKHSGIYTILFFGINGTGKTTSIAKIAHLLKKNKISCALAAGDTFRAASIEQIKTHGERLEVPVISQQYNSDPAAVAFDAKTYAQKHGIKVVLIDTAGRMYTKDNLLKEMEKIVRVGKPDLKLFVGESITGNDAIDQAKTFNETIGLDGIILSKADIDEKAGTILSVSYVTKKPIYFLGTGQNYEDLEVFTKKTVLKNLGFE